MKKYHNALIATALLLIPVEGYGAIETILLQGEVTYNQANGTGSGNYAFINDGSVTLNQIYKFPSATGLWVRGSDTVTLNSIVALTNNAGTLVLQPTSGAQTFSVTTGTIGTNVAKLGILGVGGDVTINSSFNVGTLNLEPNSKLTLTADSLNSDAIAIQNDNVELTLGGFCRFKAHNYERMGCSSS